MQAKTKKVGIAKLLDYCGNSEKEKIQCVLDAVPNIPCFQEFLKKNNAWVSNSDRDSHQKATFKLVYKTSQKASPRSAPSLSQSAHVIIEVVTLSDGSILPVYSVENERKYLSTDGKDRKVAINQRFTPLKACGTVKVSHGLSQNVFVDSRSLLFYFKNGKKVAMKSSDNFQCAFNPNELDDYDRISGNEMRRPFPANKMEQVWKFRSNRDIFRPQEVQRFVAEPVIDHILEVQIANVMKYRCDTLLDGRTSRSASNKFFGFVKTEFVNADVNLNVTDYQYNHVKKGPFMSFKNKYRDFIDGESKSVETLRSYYKGKENERGREFRCVEDALKNSLRIGDEIVAPWSYVNVNNVSQKRYFASYAAAWKETTKEIQGLMFDT